QTARTLQDQPMEPLEVGGGDDARLLEYLLLRVPSVAQGAELELRATFGSLPHQRDLEEQPSVQDVRERRRFDLQENGRVLRRQCDVRQVRARTPASASADAEKILALEDSKRLAQRGAGHPVLRHEVQLAGKGIALLELAHDDLTLQLERHELRGLRYPDA